jgi:sulfite oxidase
VTFEDKVYDISDWIAAHPGGDVILRAAGGSIDPYWDIFSIHKAQHVYDILAQYQIGFIDIADLVNGRPPAEEIEDPFANDPERDPRLITHTANPRNAEPPNEELDREFHTPNELFYVRHHMWVPVVKEEEAEDHVLTVELPDGDSKQYTLRELRTKFPIHRVTAVLQCSGNRRNDMTRHAGKTNGLQWGVGAISNAEWEGVRLADVLADAGLRVGDATSITKTGTPGQSQEPNNDSNTLPNPNDHHVQFSGLEAYGASIPLSTALDPRGDVLLAFSMNGAPLPRDHGYPLRSIIPGHVAARSVKWLSKITVADEESSSQWQRRDYKSFGPNEGPNPDWDRAKSIQEMPVTSAITGIWVGECLEKVPWLQTPSPPDTTSSRSSDGKGTVDIAAVSKKVGFTPSSSSSTTSPAPIAVQGYAYSGGGREISRVDISLDNGKTWDQVSLLPDWETSRAKGSKHWAWKRWRYQADVPSLAPGECATVVVKATDDAYNTQPEDHRGIYNVRGNLATAWHRVRVCPRCVKKGERSGGRGGVTWEMGEMYGCGFEKDANGVREHMIASGAK